MPMKKDLDLGAYFRKRAASLATSLLDAVTKELGSDSAARNREFEEHVERRLRNGAKFIPRKRKSG